jgi:hypothetical protein
MLNLAKGDKGVVLCWMNNEQTCVTDTGYLEAFEQYIIRHHADRYIVCIDVQTTYSHIPEYDDARTLISSNCTSTVD